MIYIWLILIASALLQIPRMLLNQMYRTLIVYIGLSFFAGIYGSIVALRIPLISPTDILMMISEYILSN